MMPKTKFLFKEGGSLPALPKFEDDREALELKPVPAPQPDVPAVIQKMLKNVSEKELRELHTKVGFNRERCMTPAQRDLVEYLTRCVLMALEGTPQQQSLF